MAIGLLHVDTIYMISGDGQKVQKSRKNGHYHFSWLIGFQAGRKLQLWRHLARK